MRLYLIQHGLAKAKEEDPERPLNTQGQNESETMAYFIAGKLQELPQYIYHSGKARARQTAEIFGAALGATSAVETTEDLAPTDDPGTWFTRLKSILDDTMLVGHMPHLSRLASLVLAGDPERGVVKFVNSGVVCLERDNADHWSIEWVVVPEVL